MLAQVWNHATTTYADIVEGVGLHPQSLAARPKEFAFASAGARRPMLGFQFCIETGASTPVACCQSHYGIHESPILQEHINDLLHNGHIVPTIKGGWLSKALLAPKPHQEHVHNILEFIWHFCVNYRPLNSVTEPYLYPIPCCDDTLNFGDGSGCRLYFISFDAKSGYHQIAVYEPHQCKLATQLPKVLLRCYALRTPQCPAVYIATMQILRQEAYDLFCSRHPQSTPMHLQRVRTHSLAP